MPTQSPAQDESIDSTVFTMSLDMPQPDQAPRTSNRRSVLRVAKLTTPHSEALCRIRNISAGGLTAETPARHKIGELVCVELSPHQKIAGVVAWMTDSAVGIEFEQDVDLEIALTHKVPAGDISHRPPRINLSCLAVVRIGAIYHTVEVHDISQGGIKVEIGDTARVGEDAVVTVEGLRAVHGTVRWHKNGRAGIAFHQAIPFQVLASWFGERLRMASEA